MCSERSFPALHVKRRVSDDRAFDQQKRAGIHPFAVSPERVDFHPEVTRVFHRELTHLEVMFRWSGLGQDIVALPLFPGRYGGTGFEAEAVVAGLQDVAAMGQAIEECRRHFGIAKDGGPFAEAQVRGDDDAGPLVEFAQQMEEQRAA